MKIIIVLLAIIICILCPPLGIFLFVSALITAPLWMPLVLICFIVKLVRR